jgi:AcrR family transcriptional regulator
MDRRIDILDKALDLMAREGAHGTSMRAVAAAAGVNVATLYHYFPTKKELLEAAIAHRGARELLPHPFPAGLDGSVEDRLFGLLEALCTNMFADDAFWRAVLGEALHGDPAILEGLLQANRAFEAALSEWLRDLVPDAPQLIDPSVVRALRHTILGVMLEYLPQPENRPKQIAETAREIASVYSRLDAT